jgi:hypothetical protein
MINISRFLISSSITVVENHVNGTCTYVASAKSAARDHRGAADFKRTERTELGGFAALGTGIDST